MDNYSLYFEFSNIISMENNKALKYAEEFFKDDMILYDYLSQFELNDNEVLAIESLFEKGDLETRVDKALGYDKYCFEALIIKTKMIDDEDLLYDFYEDNHIMMINSMNLTYHARENVLLFLNLYADFLYEVSQSEDSLNVQKEIVYILGELEYSLVFRMLYTLDRLGNIEEIFDIYLEFRKHIYDVLVYLNIAKVLYEIEYIEEAKLVLNDMFKMDIDIDASIDDYFSEIEKDNFYNWLKKFKDNKEGKND